ncbi:GntR family transcriptional regulator [Microbispora sp. H10836]|uniref:GntR family transcriptional regulator n=1 Tax=Microbispora sp. H10836 TaxID=2729106 RepID=UPI001473E93C|nr:GntR family transcriptional regulator [Microbispora sp. H10836]
MRTAPERRKAWLTGQRVSGKLAERLRERIATGVYPAGRALPSETALTAEFRVARNTVRRALRTLEAEGLIVTVPSKGRLVQGPGAPVDASYRYQLIARELRRRIERGDLGPGDLLPSEAELRWLYDASRNTVRQAFAELEREGLIVSRQGKGRFVRSHE